VKDVAMYLKSALDISKAKITSHHRISPSHICIYILSSRVFKCSQDHAKRAYFRSLNAIFGKI